MDQAGLEFAPLGRAHHQRDAVQFPLHLPLLRPGPTRGNSPRGRARCGGRYLQIFQTRLEMVNSAIERHFGPRLAEISCIDVGCHEGFYSVAMAKKGIRSVTGVDVREGNLRRARFVADAMGCPHIVFRQADCEQIRAEEFGRHELTLFLGLLYHLENPMLCLRNINSITKELCVIETQVIDEVEGETEWGAREWTRPYQGALALIDESGEFYNDNARPGARPSPPALRPKPSRLCSATPDSGRSNSYLRRRAPTSNTSAASALCARRISDSDATSYRSSSACSPASLPSARSKSHQRESCHSREGKQVGVRPLLRRWSGG